MKKIVLLLTLLLSNVLHASGIQIPTLITSNEEAISLANKIVEKYDNKLQSITQKSRVNQGVRLKEVKNNIYLLIEKLEKTSFAIQKTEIREELDSLLAEKKKTESFSYNEDEKSDIEFYKKKKFKNLQRLYHTVILTKKFSDSKFKVIATNYIEKKDGYINAQYDLIFDVHGVKTYKKIEIKYQRAKNNMFKAEHIHELLDFNIKSNVRLENDRYAYVQKIEIYYLYFRIREIESMELPTKTTK